jgi:hypothetical protein
MVRVRIQSGVRTRLHVIFKRSFDMMRGWWVKRKLGVLIY